MLVFVGNWYRRDLCLVSCELLSFDSVNIDSKHFYNFNAFVFMISSILSRLSVFNNGSVWALYLLPVIIRTALFCSLNIRSDLKPHDNMQYCRWGKIKLLYKIYNIFWGKNRFNLHIIPSDLDILFDIFCTCPFYVKCWSIVKPKKSKQ